MSSFDRGNKQPPVPPSPYSLPPMPQDAHGGLIINPEAAGAELLICPECGKSVWAQVVGMEVKFKLKGPAGLSIIGDTNTQQPILLCATCGKVLSMEELLTIAKVQLQPNQEGEENADS